MKKGFTLVELAIVLIIIGIIVGMATKGKSLINDARARKDMAAVQRLAAAHATFSAMRGGSYISDNVTPMIEAGVITAADLALNNYVIDGSTPANTLNLTFVRMSNDPVNSPEYSLPSGSGTSLPMPAVVNATDGSMSARMMCYLELMLDDQSARAGAARGFDGKNFSDLSIFDDCAAQEAHSTMDGVPAEAMVI